MDYHLSALFFQLLVQFITVFPEFCNTFKKLNNILPLFYFNLQKKFANRTQLASLDDNYLFTGIFLDEPIDICIATFTMTTRIPSIPIHDFHNLHNVATKE